MHLKGVNMRENSSFVEICFGDVHVGQGAGAARNEDFLGGKAKKSLGECQPSPLALLYHKGVGSLDYLY